MNRVAEGLVRSVGQKPPPSEEEHALRGLVAKPPPAPSVQRESAGALKEPAGLTQSERMKLAKEGKALPDGSFPIRNVADLKNARIRAHQANDPAAAFAHIKKRERALGVKLGPIGK